MNKPPMTTKCPACGRIAAETTCSLCKTPRAVLVSLDEIAEAIRLDAQIRANDYANDRNKAERENPLSTYNQDGDYSVYGSRLRPGR